MDREKPGIMICCNHWKVSPETLWIFKISTAFFGFTVHVSPQIWDMNVYFRLIQAQLIGLHQGFYNNASKGVMEIVGDCRRLSTCLEILVYHQIQRHISFQGDTTCSDTQKTVMFATTCSCEKCWFYVYIYCLYPYP
jgi:hypothetical protein